MEPYCRSQPGPPVAGLSELWGVLARPGKAEGQQSPLWGLAKSLVPAEAHWRSLALPSASPAVPAGMPTLGRCPTPAARPGSVLSALRSLAHGGYYHPHLQAKCLSEGSGTWPLLSSPPALHVHAYPPFIFLHQPGGALASLRGEWRREKLAFLISIPSIYC